MRLSAMGDVAMTVPVLNALVHQHPEVRITIISRPFFKPFFNNIPNLTFFSFDADGRHKGFFGLLRLFRDLNPTSIAAFADLHNVLRSKICRTLFALSGKKVAYTNKARAEKKALTQANNKQFKQLTCVFERHAKVFESLGFPVDFKQPNVLPKPTLGNAIHALLETHNKKRIGIAPFAQYESKIYPLDLMQEVIAQLANDKENQIFLFGGGKAEIETLIALKQNHENVVVVAGLFSLEEELQLIAQLDLMLSMDSGNAHLAAMFGVNVITLWGATHPFAGFAPFNQPMGNSLVSDRNQFPKLPTSIYGNKKVAGYENAMRTITPTKVVHRIQSQLANPHQKPKTNN